MVWLPRQVEDSRCPAGRQLQRGLTEVVYQSTAGKALVQMSNSCPLGIWYFGCLELDLLSTLWTYGISTVPTTMLEHRFKAKIKELLSRKIVIHLNNLEDRHIACGMPSCSAKTHQLSKAPHQSPKYRRRTPQRSVRHEVSCQRPKGQSHERGRKVFCPMPKYGWPHAKDWDAGGKNG